MTLSRISELFIKKSVFILVCLLIFNVNKLKGQERNCGTMTYLEQQQKNDPTLVKKIQENEVKLQNWIKNNANKNLGSIISIPVVVHVVYNNNNENISDQQIQSQIDILNEDFRRQNADAVNTPSAFLSVAADTEIEFCLATEDADGNITTGITRTSTSQSSFSTSNGVKYTSSGGIDAWNPLQYLNIWVCDLSGGLLGYAQFPGGTVSSDGVVCDYAYFGNIGTATSPYDLGRTATHEVGHWLNLRHIWGDSNCGNDFCNDTPEHSGSNYGCPSYPSTSNCSGNGTSGDMFMNYMDYTDDACMNIFTQDQKTRMIASINNNRSGLITSNGCSNADYGCTDQTAYNYSSVAIFNDGSCCYNAGCTDITAINYDASVCFDDGSCQPPILGCTNPSAINFDPAANTSIANGGALDNTFSSGGYFTGNQHLNFDASKECIIRSAMVYAQTAETITFELRNSGGTVLDDTTLSIPAGQQIIDLNLEVPIGSDFQLGIAAANSNLYRNNAGANYPYNIASAINITSSSATSSPYGYYYFYYNIEVEIPCQSISVPSWDCDGQGNCSDPGTGNGQYSSLSQCQSSCVVPSWDCDNQGNCYDPGNGTGQYSSLSSCQSSCIVPSWDCDNQGNCYDPGNGTGQYSSLVSCQSSCIVPSWDCNNQGYCYDPGNGQGVYSSISDCEVECVNVSVYDNGITQLKLFPNPFKGLINIQFINTQKCNLELKIFNSIGESIYKESTINHSGEYRTSINLERYPKSIYFMQIQTDNGVVYKKIISQ